MQSLRVGLCTSVGQVTTSIFRRGTSATQLLISSAVILLHFQIASLGGFPLTIAPLATLLLLTKWRRLSTKSLGPWMVLVALFVLPFINVWQVTGAGTDVVQDFARTYSLWSLACFMLWCTHFLNARTESTDDLLPRAAFGCLVIVVAFCVAQIAAWRITGSDALYNPFGSRQYLYALDMPFGAGGLVRAKGFFLEPSFCALVILTLWLVCVLRNYRVTASSVVATVGVVATSSVVGLLALAAFILVFWAAGRHRSRWRYLVAVLGVGALLGIVVPGVGGYVVRRLLEIQTPGTSGYWRVTAPLSMIRELLTSYPTGILLGRADQYVASFGVLRGNAVGSSVDNGIQILVFYFGWLGLAAVIALFCCAVGALLRRDRPTALVTWYLLLSLLFTGGILVPEYVFLQVLVLQAGRQSLAMPTLGTAGALSGTRR